VRRLLALFVAAAILAMAPEAWAAAATPEVVLPWWGWPLSLFVVCFFLGIVAVPAGVGGGVLFVPIVGGFFPSTSISSAAPGCSWRSRARCPRVRRS